MPTDLYAERSADVLHALSWAGLVLRTNLMNAQTFLKIFTIQLLPRGGPGRYPGYQPADFKVDLSADFLDSPSTPIRRSTGLAIRTDLMNARTFLMNCTPPPVDRFPEVAPESVLPRLVAGRPAAGPDRRRLDRRSSRRYSDTGGPARVGL